MTRGIACSVALAALCLACSAPPRANAADPLLLSLGKLALRAPVDWVSKPPRSQLISYELAAPAAKGDAEGGRLTVMAAGGGVEANVARWCGQFTQPDGGDTRQRAKVEKLSIANQEVHLVDIAGTYDDKPAAFSPGVKKEKFRMLAAIIVTKEASFFLKFSGPQATIEAQAQAFRDMIDSLHAP